jgi:hypothetical protein
MDKIEIPKTAYDAFAAVVPIGPVYPGLEAAAPFIITAELRRLTDELDSYEISSPGLAIAIGHILNRIDELEPQQVTVTQRS